MKAHLDEFTLKFKSYRQLSYKDNKYTVTIYLSGKLVGVCQVYTDKENNSREYICINYEVVYLDTLARLVEVTYTNEDKETVTEDAATIKIEDTEVGEFVKLNAESKSVYKRLTYCKINKAYELQLWEGKGQDYKYLKKGKEVVVGFTY
jgi:hypothetical protein